MENFVKIVRNDLNNKIIGDVQLLFNCITVCITIHTIL